MASKIKVLDYTSEKINDILAGAEHLDNSLSEESENIIKNKAIYNQYMDNDDTIDILEELFPGYKRRMLKKECLTFEILTDGEIKWMLNNSDSSMARTIKVQINNGEWRNCTSVIAGGESSIPVQAGDIVKLKATNSTYGSSGTWSAFTGTTCKFNVKGNIMSLINEDNFENLESFNSAQYVFSHLFYECYVVEAKDLILPKVTVAGCYVDMFAFERTYSDSPNDSELVSAPELPAMTLSSACYKEMFMECHKLTTAPDLPALTMQSYCYCNMFYNCRSLVKAPELPAMTLASYCYQLMFGNCVSLINPPSLPATNLEYACYQQMFFHCPFVTAPVISATTLAYYCCDRMFQNCKQLENGPDLLATSFPSTNRHCYDGMFNSCEKLKRVKCLATPRTGNTDNWMVSVASSGTFIKSSSASWSSGTSGIPSGWTVQNA